jgi:hypothetical protein
MYLRSYLFMRVMIGVIGVALPIVLVSVDWLLYSQKLLGRDSLSSYYHSGVRDLFVGALSAAAVFLVTYKVVERNLDNALSVLAGLAALTIALFPTGRSSDTTPLTALQELLGEGSVEVVHYVASAVFLVSLGVLSFFFGLREGRRPQQPGRRSPAFWRWFHWACTGVIAAALLFIVVTSLLGGPSKSLLIGEAIALWAFGASWFMKGLELDILRGTRPPTGDSATPAPPT